MLTYNLSAMAAGSGLWPLVAAAALIDSFNPCAVSVILISIAFLFSLGKSRKTILCLGISYAAGIFIVYLLIGLGLLQALGGIGAPYFMAKIGAALLIALGADNLLSRYRPGLAFQPKLLVRLKGRTAALIDRGSTQAFLLLGGLVGLAEFPCSGGPYLMILGLLHDRKTFSAGLGYLFWYNSIFILPLLALVAIASNPALLKKVQRFKKSESRLTKAADDLLMILLGLLIFFL